MPSRLGLARRRGQLISERSPARKVLAALVLAGSMWVVAGSADASAASYYVSPSGSDAASGSSTAPFRTISKAATLATAGDTVLVASGRYGESISLTSSSRGVTFRGTGESRPIVDGQHERQYGFLNHAASDVTIENFEVTGQTDSGIYMAGSGNRIAGNLIHHVGSARISHSNGVRIVQGGRTVVQDNTIHSIGPGSESMGIWLLQTRDADVAGNTVYLVRKEGVRDWMGLDNTIRNNRFFLNWAGVSFNGSVGAFALNNYIYDNVQGFVAKHTAYQDALDLWKLTTPRWSRFWHNTVYRSTEANVWVAQSDPPADYLDVRNNLLVDAGAAHVRDTPEVRGPHVIVDGNAYAYPAADGRPTWLYKGGWSSDPGLSDWSTYRSQLGWETNGTLMGNPGLIDPASGNLDYPPTSPAAAGSLQLNSPLGSQLGARGLPPTRVRWTPYPMKAVDSSSKDTWWTQNHLGDSADDNQSTYWLTATATNEYVTYDFGQPRTFDHLVLSIYQHYDVRNPHGYRFEVSDDRVNWRTVLAGENPDTAGSSFKYELPQPATGRYLRYTMIDTSCESYSPRTSCGTYFVFSDLKAGSVTTTTASEPVTTWRAVGSAPLSDSVAAQRVAPVAEKRPENAQYNAYIPTAAELTSFRDRLDVAYNRTMQTYNPLVAYVTGGFSGTTDEIMQWVAHKWGIPEDIVRAVGVQESYHHHLKGPNQGLGDRETVPDPTIYPEVSRIAGTSDVYASLGVSQVRWSPNIHWGTEPLRWKSTAFNLDYWAATVRYYFDGLCDWCTPGYSAGQEWNSIGAWFNPSPWGSSQTYIDGVQNHVAQKPWNQAGF